jgi:hypothetical protein
MWEQFAQYGLAGLVIVLVLERLFKLVKNIIDKWDLSHQITDQAKNIHITNCPLGQEGVTKTIDDIDERSEKMLGKLNWLHSQQERTEKDYQNAIKLIESNQVVFADLRTFIKESTKATTIMSGYLQQMLNELKKTNGKL